MQYALVKDVKFSGTAILLDAHLKLADSRIVSSRCLKWMKGFSVDAMPDLAIIEARSGETHGSFHYLSANSFRSSYAHADVQDEYLTEFCLKVRSSDSLHVELLSMVAYMHRDPQHRLDVGHTMKIGRPLISGSNLDRLLVSLPYPYGPDFEYLKTPSGQEIRILWLLPITQSEETFCHRFGLEALEERFEEAEIDVLNPFRNNVA